MEHRYYVSLATWARERRQATETLEPPAAADDTTILVPFPSVVTAEMVSAAEDHHDERQPDAA